MVFNFRKNLEKRIRKGVYYALDRPVFNPTYSKKFLDKTVDVITAITNISLSIGIFIGTMFVMFKLVMPRLGFEKTIVFMLAIIISMFKNFFDTQKKEGE